MTDPVPVEPERAHRLFVYGTLQHAPLFDALVGRASPTAMVPARLAGHRAAPLAGRPYPGLVEDPAHVASGHLVTVDGRELAVLDAFEGPQYERRTFEVELSTGTTADAYLLTGADRALVTEGAWDLARFVATDAARWVAEADPGAHHPDGSGPR